MSGPRSSHLAGTGSMLVACAAASSMSAAAHGLAGRCSWQLVLFCRLLTGVAVAAATSRAMGDRVTLRGPPGLWFRSIAGALVIPCTFYAYAHLPPGDAICIMSTSPIFVALISMFFLGQRLSARVWIAIAGGVIGIALIERPHFASDPMGALAATCTSIGLAVAQHAVSRLRHRVSSNLIVFHSSAIALVSAAIFLAVEMSRRPVMTDARPSSFVLLALVGAFGATSAITTTRASALGNPSLMATVSYTSIAWGVVFDWTLFHKAPEPVGLLGIALIVGPMIWMLRHPVESRLTRGGRAMAADLRELDESARDRLARAVGEAERRTSCELRVHVDRERAGAVDERSGALFDELGMAATRKRNGVLLYIALTPPRFVVVADVGVSRIVPAREIDRVCRDVEARLAAHGDPTPALESGIAALAELLASYFPWTEDDVDELPNGVSAA